MGRWLQFTAKNSSEIPNCFAKIMLARSCLELTNKSSLMSPSTLKKLLVNLMKITTWKMTKSCWMFWSKIVIQYCRIFWHKLTTSILTMLLVTISNLKDTKCLNSTKIWENFWPPNPTFQSSKNLRRIWTDFRSSRKSRGFPVLRNTSSNSPREYPSSTSLMRLHLRQTPSWSHLLMRFITKTPSRVLVLMAKKHLLEIFKPTKKTI